MSEQNQGWQPMPVSLKILFVVLTLWMVGSVMNLPNLYENGMPLFGTMVTGVTATILPVMLDLIGPSVFLFALWTRKSWAICWALGYNGVFIVNNTVAFITLSQELGVPQILIPTAVSMIFLAVIVWKRRYFTGE